MEDSERRRERLKAMRAAAAQAEAEVEASSHVETSAVSGFLANPLLDNPAQSEPSTTQRFDFYTDPMAAFSASRRRSAPSNQPAQGYFTPRRSNGPPVAQFSSPVAGSRNPDMTPCPAYQMQPNQIMHQAQGPYSRAAPYRSPRAGPFPVHQGTPNAWNVPGTEAGYYSSVPYRGTTSPYPTNEGNPGFQPAGSPSFNYGQGRPPWRGNSPNLGSVRGGSSTHSGRGQGQWHGSSRGQFSGRIGGRGRGFHSQGTASDKAFSPESFYDKSMVEDPWEHLEPVLWRVLEVPQSSNSWLPKSISMKKPRTSESSNDFNSKQSLAEYLAASFNEAVNDAPKI